MRKLNAKNLKQVLWETLNGIKTGEVKAPDADAIASQAREILRTTRTQLHIFQQANERVSDEMLEFALNREDEA